MNTDQLSLRPDAASIYDEHHATYLAQLVEPMDGMGAAFADLAVHRDVAVRVARMTPKLESIS